MHPNLRETHRVLTGAGVRCVYVVAKVGPSEPSEFENRTLINPTDCSSQQIEDLVRTLKPDVLIQRNFDGAFGQIWHLAKLAGAQTFRYTQDPKFIPYRDAMVRPVRAARMMRDYLRYRRLLGPHLIVTPVERWGPKGQRALPGTFYVAPPMELRRGKGIHESSVVTLVTVGKHGQKSKRIKWLLKAVEGTAIPIQLNVVGSMPRGDQKRWIARDLNLRNHAERISRDGLEITFFDDLDEGELRRMYSRCDLFVLPGKREHMAISPLEAMAHGTPVLVSSDNGAAGYVRTASSDQLFRARSYRSFRNKLTNLVVDENLRSALGVDAAFSVKENHAPANLENTLATKCHETCRVDPVHL